MNRNADFLAEGEFYITDSLSMQSLVPRLDDREICINIFACSTGSCQKLGVEHTQTQKLLFYAII